MVRFSGLLLVLFLGVGATRPGKNKPVKLIIDTDIGGGGCNDVDDVVVCLSSLLLVLHNNENLFSFTVYSVHCIPTIHMHNKAVCMANALMDNGEAEILGIVQNTAPLECAGAISVCANSTQKYRE